MPFSQTIIDKALDACARHCCICHRFCGKNIEVHHIIQEADGGENSFDNAIPLCFKCHADMGRTDPHHPKGRSYTPNELKKHRERWYANVEAGIVESAEPRSANDGEETKEYIRKYKTLRFMASCMLDYYANVYTDIVGKVDERHEKASDALRSIGVVIKAFATEERPNETCVPSVYELKEVGGLFIGLSNSLYSCHGGGDEDFLLEANLRSEEKIREILHL